MAERPRLTRRGLLRGLGTVTAVAGCAKPQTSGEAGEAALSPGAEPSPGLEVIGPGPALLRLEVNGAAHGVTVATNATLLTVLREELGLRGAKEVCDRGACGACMVLVDGVLMNSCVILAHTVAGRAITTVEGLAKDGQLTPVQRAFIAHDAAQCGFCTSGMVISATALLRRPGPHGRPAIAAAMAGNLCRCGSYDGILAAIASVSGAAPETQGEG